MDFKKLEQEVFRFRALLDPCNKAQTELITDEFPVMNCKISSIVLAYHLISIWPDIEVLGVGGEADNNSNEETISHYWLELGNFSIDITADQYNIIDDDMLNDDIIKKRPFKPVNIGLKNYGLLYELFHISYKDKYKKNFPSVKKDFFRKVKICHSQLM